MFKEIRTLHSGDPACQKRSDNDHLRFIIHRKQMNDQLTFDFTIELDGVRSWTVPDVPSMNPMDQRQAKEDQTEANKNLQKNIGDSLAEDIATAWDKGNYIPIDDSGNVLSEFEALESLHEGCLKFFLQGTKLVGEFVFMRINTNDWLLMKRHDEFALYNYYNLEAVES